MSLEIKIRLYFILIPILTEINSINYIILIGLKKIQNTNIIICKLRLATIKVTNLKLKFVKKEIWKKLKLVKRWKVEVTAIKQ